MSGAPTALFQTIGLYFPTLSPVLRQVFFIGDGLTSTNIAQQFNIPGGSTRLFLGTMDGFGWFNNSGAISVTVTQVGAQPPAPSGIPEPATWALLAAALAGLRLRCRSA